MTYAGRSAPASRRHVARLVALLALPACSSSSSASDAAAAIDVPDEDRSPPVDTTADTRPLDVATDATDATAPEAAVDAPPASPDERVVQLTAGARHTCALQARGTVYCWGSNGNGQLGDGTTRTTRRAPVRVRALDDATQIAAGGLFTCALHRDGAVSCWGTNVNGELGEGVTGSDRATPARVAGVDQVTRLAAGSGHTCALRRDETVVCWGWNRFAQIGDGTMGGVRRPTAVAGLSAVVEVDAGWSHTCARLRDGTLRCWGFNEGGQIGDGTRGDLTGRPTPTPVMGLSGVLEVAAGATRSAARTAPDAVWVWGRNEQPFRTDEPTLVPTRFGSFSDVAQLAPSSGFTCVRLTSGRVRCWGRGALGALGNGSDRDQVAPTEVVMLDDAVEIAAGDGHACARRRGGSLVCWGNNSDGALGNGATQTRSLVPVAVLPAP